MLVRHNEHGERLQVGMLTRRIRQRTSYFGPIPSMK